MRLEGKSLREIKQILGPMSNSSLHDALKGTPPSDWTRRPNAKAELKAQARELRQQGWSVRQIERHLGVARSTVSVWVRDIELGPEQRQRLIEQSRLGPIVAGELTTSQAPCAMSQPASIELTSKICQS